MKYIFIILFLQFEVLNIICEGAVVLDFSGCKTEQECRKSINTQFYLHTREDPSRNINIVINRFDLLAISTSSYNAFKPTKFIVHGYLDSGDTKWLMDMAQALLIYGDYNVIRVDWRHGSRTTYNLAVMNARIVGLEIADLINTLTAELNLQPSNIHCIGHSLGSHVCGYTGREVPGLGRITGLDPMGSLFTATVKFQRLSPLDAGFVDVIHTNIENKANRKRRRSILSEPLGNIEIFPNSGSNQPGCTVANSVKNIFSRDIVESARSFVYCSHLRSIEYFTETLLNPTCQWVAFKCLNYAAFNEGKCSSCGEDNSKCAFLGIIGDQYVDKSKVGSKFYIKTNAAEPFCAQHYIVTISIAFPVEVETLSGGKLTVWIAGNVGQFYQEVQISINDHGASKRALITSHIDVGPITRIDLEWSSFNCLLNPFCRNVIYIQGIQVSPISHYPESNRKSYEVKACQATDGTPTPIQHKETKPFPVNKDCQIF